MKRAILLLCLGGCGRSDVYRAVPPRPAPLDASVDLPRKVTQYSAGFYNSDLGRILDGTQREFPRAESYGADDPVIEPASEPNLEAAKELLGHWLERQPPPGNGHWRALADIPRSWEVNTETAVVFPVFSETEARLRANVGADNGIFIWVNGVFRFGALAPGGWTATEYPNLDLGPIPAGLSYVQVLREDHGGTTGYSLDIAP